MINEKITTILDMRSISKIRFIDNESFKYIESTYSNLVMNYINI